MYKAICIKSYVDEEDLRLFIEGEITNLTKKSIIKEGFEYLVARHYDPEYFKLIEEKDEKTN
tara:strand:+ start:328 stop:513 length:186 start_codon:yes stop_codon:yes gene_type:complete